MSTRPFNDDWTFRRRDEEPNCASPVTLPHDAMISESRSASASTGNHGGYFPGGAYVYETRWMAPEADDQDRWLRFDGVYGQTVVRIDDAVVARNVSPYREFRVPLPAADGLEHRIEVDVDNSATPNSRWYTGSGIYRAVWIEQRPRTRFAHDGIRVRTLSLGAVARVEFDLRMQGDALEGATVSVQLLDGDTPVAEASAEVVTERLVLELDVPNPRAWSDLDPFRYTAIVRLTSAASTDEQAIRVGLRTVEVDAASGLRINGQTVLLRGACVHHDSGILGAATFRAAEYRRARLLKEAGFNAIRSAHNPLSRELVEACDELGLYVLDELTDVWVRRKTPHDLAQQFEELWEDDAASLIAKNRNSPSVIMYSIGNEIGETATASGVDVARRLSNYFRKNDPDRPTTVAVNLLLNVMATRGVSPFEIDREKAADGPTSTAANVIANKLGGIVLAISRLPIADKASRDVFATVDVAGYNYAWTRYRKDRHKHPERVILGTESMPGDLARIWPLVEELPHVIGDFMWTGWDYLGESGIGTWTYGDQPAGISKPYPHLVAGCGALDITGVAGAPMLLARAVWGLDDAPGIAVRPLDHAGEKTNRVAWRTTDAVPSWSWRGADGRTAEIEVYSDGDMVELLLDGTRIGRKPAGRRRGYVARFRTSYRPGRLVAVAYRNGKEIGRSTLRSAVGPLSLRLISDKQALAADGQDLAHLSIELVDAAGVIDSLASDRLTVVVEGAGVLAGLGSGANAPLDSYSGSVTSTFQGRALAVIRSNGEAGEVRVSVSGAAFGDHSVVLSASN